MVGSSFKEVTKREPSYLITGASTYLKLVENFTNFGPIDIFAGRDALLFHKKNEKIAIETLEENLVLFAHTLQKMILIDKAPIK